MKVDPNAKAEPGNILLQYVTLKQGLKNRDNSGERFVDSAITFSAS